MNYFLTKETVLKWLEAPSVYHIGRDDLYELDDASFEFLKKCSSERDCHAEESEFTDYCLKEGLLTQEETDPGRPPLIRSPQPSLRYLELQITNRCNLRCRHCYLDNRAFDELPFTEIRNILTEFEEMQGLRVLLTGGEPLLHSRFDDINSMLQDFFLRKILFTNGLLLDDRMLSNLNVHEIQFSIDGLEDAHDALRGKGTYRTTLDAVERSRDAGFEVSVSTMVHAKNLQDFEEMEELFNGLCIKDWTVDVPCATGRLLDNAEFRVTPEQGGKYLGYGYGDGLHSGATGFGCGLHLMAVMADGRIAKCSFFGGDSVGTVKDGLRACWQRIDPVRLNELDCNCKHIEICRGGCRYRAELLGNPLGRDLYRCVLYDILNT